MLPGGAAGRRGVDRRARGSAVSEPLPLAMPLNVNPAESVPSYGHSTVLSGGRGGWAATGSEGGVGGDRRVGGLGSVGTNWQEVHDTLGFS